MKKKKLKAKIKKLKMQVIEARTSAVGAHIAKALVGAAIGGSLVVDAGELAIPKKPQAGEPEIIGKLRRMAEAAAAKGKSEP